MDPLIKCYNFLTSTRAKKVILLLDEHFQLLAVKVPILKYLVYLRSYDQVIEELKEITNKLKKTRYGILYKVKEEEKYAYGQIDEEVREWIEEVSTIISEYENFTYEAWKQNDVAAYDLPTSGYLPKVGIRVPLSEKAFNIASKVKDLLERANHDSFSDWLAPPNVVDYFDNINCEWFPSRMETMVKAKKALNNPYVRVIGLYGPSGVGKTTLAKEIARQALEGSEEGKIFDVVAMANVTKYPDVRKIQGQIADSLGMKLDEESDIVRAARIRKRLKNEKESTLIILDDILAELDLSMLGIPLVSGDCKGCKVLLISESRQVLSIQMEWEMDSIYFVDVLRENEAEMLFKRMAGIDRNSEVVKLATQIASKCNGLPMLIVTTARALKDRRRLVWEDALQEFERGKLTVASDFSTILSYGLLENEELKDVFLLCARMGPDTLIMDLVKYCIGLGCLQEVHSVMETRDRVYLLVGKLKLSGLLYESYSGDRFTMSDIVRSAALSKVSKEKHVYTKTKEIIDDWPDVDNLVVYEAISLHHCYIIDGFPPRINFRKLRLFHVNNNDPHLVIPDKLFKGMKELKVLILIGINLSPLPSSIGSLTKLGMLCLEYCKLGEGLSIVGKLKKLRVLSLSGSDIEKLPVELKHLTKLQLLDISNCSKLEEIPSNVISSLISLEELCMRNTFVEWEFQGRTNQSEKASLSELGHVNQFTNLDIQIPNAALLPKNMFFNKRSSYKIVIGDLNADTEINLKMPEKYEASRYLAIHLKEGFDIHSRKGVKLLFETVQHLSLQDLDGVNDLFYSLNLNGFPYLKHLLIAYNSNIQYLIGSKERPHLQKVFCRLKSLHLYNLKNLRNMCFWKVSAPSFGCLKEIKINLCGRLKQVFIFSMISLLTVLETIEVSECNALEEIVPLEVQSNLWEVQSNNQEIMLLKFPELRSLTLMSLPELIGFNPIRLIEGESTELFHKKVDVPKLERMVLSSLRISIIWRDQSLLRPCFQNLIHLDVNDCWNLTYLISISMAMSLVNLQSLFVSKCEKMSYIFYQGDWSRSKTEVFEPKQDSIFPNLKIMKLSCMNSLTVIWNYDFSSNSFGKLDTLVIEECYRLKNVFTGYMEAMFESLRKLRVTNCNSMKIVFVLDENRNDRNATNFVKKKEKRNATNLQDVCLETLPNLEQIWNFYGNIKLNNLQKMVVHDCGRLEYIFPVAQVKCLRNLEYLEIRDCFQLMVVVQEDQDDFSGYFQLKPSLKFPKLTTIKFLKLPRLTWFFAIHDELYCPSLDHLSIELCDRLKPFRNERRTYARTLFSEKAINDLRSMAIESWHAQQSTSSSTHNLKVLGLSRLRNPETIYSFLHRNPNLKSLSLNNCSLTDVVPYPIPPEFENSGVVSELESLKLIDLPFLKIIGFDRDIILQRIVFLILRNCPCLVNMVSSSVSLAHLTNLEVVSCDGLKTLMPRSVAKSLVRLKIMKVIKCQSMVKIVESEEENAREVVTIFTRLEVLELVSLKKLNCFSKGGKGSVIEFPFLEKLVVSACPKMEFFCEEVNSAPVLKKIFLEHEKENIWCWRQNLNTTIEEIFREKKFLEGMEEISLSEHHDLQKQWNCGAGDLKKSWFYNLKTLRLEGCQNLSCAIPSNIFLCLKSLKELEVRNCNNVRLIFENIENDKNAILSQLKNLTLEGLSKLKHVWEKNYQGNLIFQNLLHVSVSDCESLKTLFPAAVAKNIKKLKTLKIESCQNLLQIVGKQVYMGVAADVAEKFVFPCLTSLHLKGLPVLAYFYCQIFTVECPDLRELVVLKCCPRLELFYSARFESEGISTSINRFSDLEAISFLEILSVDCNDSSVLRSNLKQMTDFEFLKKIQMFFVVDDDKESTLLFDIFYKAYNLQEMSIERCKSLEIFQTANFTISEQLKLKTLTLNSVSELKFIWSEHSSWLNTVCENLYTLNVICCHDLTKLFYSAPPYYGIFFGHLKELYIEECHGLEYLFTSSEAQVLMHLEKITVKESPSIKTIVEMEQDGTTLSRFEFKRLYSITLDSLSSLEYFYSGIDTLELPSLTLVNIQQCPKLDVFSRGEISAISFRGIQASFDLNDELVLYNNDLNASVNFLFLLQQEHLVFVDSPLLKSIWLEPETVPSWCFCNLTSLVVKGCEFLADAVLPSHLLPFLSNLKTLEVQNCNSIKAIFVYTKVGPQGCLGLPLLEKLCVENCDNILEIVAKDETATEDANKVTTIFPRITYLMLRNLYNLRHIYPGVHILEWPILKELHVVHCPILNFFTTEFQSSRDLHSEYQESFPTIQQTFVSLEKVTPSLNVLSLGKEEAKMMEQGKLHVDLQELNILRLQCFHDKTDVFPFVFHSKVPLPSTNYLLVGHSAFIEIFPAQTPDVDYTKILSKLKTLELTSLPQLESIGFEHSWIGPFIENLKSIYVWDCACLTNLSPSTVSFSKLEKLNVENCHGLKYLFTSSTAKTLSVLKEMILINCESLIEIVAKEGDEPKKGEMLFMELSILTLSSLPKLGSFYSGNFALNFSSLKEVSFMQCNSTKVFRPDDEVPDDLMVTIDGVIYEGDKNEVIMQQINEATRQRLEDSKRG